VFTVLEGPEFGPAGSSTAYPRVLGEVLANTMPMVRYSLDNREILAFAVPANDDMRDLLSARRVVKLTPPGEPASEWMVSRTTESISPGGIPALIVECDPIWAIMGDVGIIEQVETGGGSFANLGGLNGKAINYIATYVVPTLQRRGVSWIEIGTIDPDIQFDLSWDAQTPLALMNLLASTVGAEWRLQRDAPNSRYVIQMAERINGTVSVTTVRERKNILTLESQRTRERLYTAIRPQGGLETGSEERANIGFNVWRVKAKSTDVLELESVLGGPGPVAEDGQWVGYYLADMGGGFRLIVDSTAPDTVQVSSGAGANFAVGDDVSFVADSSGTLITEVVSPSGVASFGYTQGKIAREERGYRNWVRNPFMRDWTSTEEGVLRVRGTSTTDGVFVVNSGPAPFAFDTDDRIVWEGRLYNITNSGSWTTPTSISMNVDASIGSSTTNVYAYVYKNAVSRGPVGFTRVSTPALLRTVGVGQAALSMQVNGAQAFNDSGTIRQTLAVKGLPANQVVPVGSMIFDESFVGQVIGFVDLESTANASGQATLSAMVLPVSLANDKPLKLYLPPVTGGGFAAGQIRMRASVGGAGTQLDATFPFRVLGSATRVVASATFAGFGSLAWNNTNAPRIELFSSATSRGVGIATDPQSGGIFVYRSGRANVVWDPVTDTNLSLQIKYLTPPTVNVNFQDICFLTGVQVALSPEDAPDIVEGSPATRLMQAANLALLAARQWPSTYSATVSEMISEWGLPQDSDAFELGAYIRIVSPSMGIDRFLRVTAVEFNPLDPKDKRLTLDTDPDRITQITAKQKARAVFVNVDVKIEDGRARETILVSESPPTVVEGVNRFVVTAGAVAPVSTSPLNVETL
jgi:hypothetical protein